MTLFSLSLLLLTGCPDPQTASTIGHGPGGAAPAGAPGAPAPSSGAISGTPPTAGVFDVTPGEGVSITGTFAYDGTKTGTYRVDFLKKEGDAPPKLLHTLELSAPGSFSLEAPKSTGSVYLVGFIDVDNDGPSPTDPSGIVDPPLVIDTSPISDVLLTISDTPDLGDFTPGGHHFDPNEIPTPDASPTPVEPAAAETPSEPPAEPSTDAPPTDAPPTDAAPTDAAPTDAPPTDAPPQMTPDTGAQAPE